MVLEDDILELQVDLLVSEDDCEAGPEGGTGEREEEAADVLPREGRQGEGQDAREKALAHEEEQAVPACRGGIRL